MKHPTVLTRTSVLSGKTFQTDCKTMYDSLDKVDRALVRSSPEFREIKRTLKDMAERKDAPTEEESKRMIEALNKTILRPSCRAV